jgi:hypothetical protein
MKTAIINCAKRQIRADIKKGLVPEVRSFGDLHDYVDANCYGGMCEDEVYEVAGDLINEVQDALNEWIIGGYND